MSDPYEPRFGRAVAPWHGWFAWRPVSTVDRGTVWLRMVWRRRIARHSHLDGGPDFWFQHCIDKPRDGGPHPYDIIDGMV